MDYSVTYVMNIIFFTLQANAVDSPMMSLMLFYSMDLQVLNIIENDTELYLQDKWKDPFTFCLLHDDA